MKSPLVEVNINDLDLSVKRGWLNKPLRLAKFAATGG